MDYEILIIIPIYNAEKYLVECLESIVNQTYKNFRVIMINDGSIDNSEKICKEYEQKYPNFHYYKQKNQGSAITRNNGLRLISDKCYAVSFLDADDWIDKNFLEILLENMINHNADVSMCDFYINETKEHNWSGGVFDKEDIFTEYVNGRILNRIMNKLYKKSVVENVFFPDGRDLMEDAVWSPLVMENVNRLVRSEKPLYHYRLNTESLTHIKKRNDRTECARFYNMMEREKILFRNIIKEEDFLQIVQQICEYLHMILISGCNLEYWDVYKLIREFLIENIDTLEFYIKNEHYKNLINMIVNEKDSKKVCKMYLKKTLFSKDFTIKTKLLILYKRMLRMIK